MHNRKEYREWELHQLQDSNWKANATMLWKVYREAEPSSSQEIGTEQLPPERGAMEMMG